MCTIWTAATTTHATVTGRRRPRWFVPAAPLARTIEDWLAEHDERTLELLSEITGLPTRTLYGIRNGERARLELDTADKLLTRLDQNERWHTDL
jgi:hypothetical protein